MPAGILLDVQDELSDLNAILDTLPGLRQLHALMVEIVKPSKTGRAADRIGSCAFNLIGKPLRAEHARPIGGCFDDADLIDLGAAPDVILNAVQHRLLRLAALIHLLTSPHPSPRP